MTEKTHLTPLVRASARPVDLLVTGSFAGQRMTGAAFIRLNGGRLNLATAKQTKMTVANLLKILRDLAVLARENPRGTKWWKFQSLCAPNSVEYG
jgi:hypothetical protein